VIFHTVRFVKVDVDGGRAHYVNPLYIRRVSAVSGATQIVLDDGNVLRTDLAIEDVIADIEGRDGA
jgi:hypothetical protein